MHPALIVLTLALLLGLQPITTDLYLPALPGLTQELGASMPQAQLTLTALLLAFGVSQLVWGPLSDRFGRRPILLVGLTAYVVASIGSAFSASTTRSQCSSIVVPTPTARPWTAATNGRLDLASACRNRLTCRSP